MSTTIPINFVLRTTDKVSGVVTAAASRIQATRAAFSKMLAVDDFKLAASVLKDDFGSLGKALKLDVIASKTIAAGQAFKELGAAVWTVGQRFANFGGFFLGVVDGARTSLDSLGQLSRRTGMSVEEFGALRFAAEKSGVSAESFASAMDTLTQNLGEAQESGAGPLMDFLNSTPNLAVFKRQILAAKSTTAAFGLMSEAIRTYSNDPTRQAVLSAKFFGESNKQMAQFALRDAGTIDVLKNQYTDLIGPQHEAVSASYMLSQAWIQTSAATDGLRNRLASAFFPVFSRVADKITDFIVNHGPQISAWAESAAQAIGKWLDDGGFEDLTGFLSTVASGVAFLVDKIGPMKVLFGAAAIAAWPLISAAGSLVATLASLAFTVGEVLITGLVSLGPSLASFGSTLANLFVAGVEGASTFATAAAEGLAEFMIVAGEAIVPLLPFIAAAASLAYLGKTIYDNWGDITDLFQNFGETVFYAVQGVKELLGSDLANALTGGAFGAVDGFVDQFKPGYLNEAAQGGSSNARVTVDFNNAPPGTRVASDAMGPMAVDTSVGVSMWGAW